MRKRNGYFIVYYKCKYCGNEFTIPRQVSKMRGVGHIKDIWCPWCKEKRKFVETGIW